MIDKTRGSGEPGDRDDDIQDGIQIVVPTGLEDLAPEYLESRRRDVRKAAALLADGDFDALRKIAHNFAGSGGSYGFQVLTELGSSLEFSALARDTSASERDLAALGDHLARVRLTNGR